MIFRRSGGAVHVGSAVAHGESNARKLSPVTLEDFEGRGSGNRRPKAHRPFVSNTYVSVRNTCPDSCGLKDAGCYAQTGFTSFHVRALDMRGRAAARRDPDRLMIEEAVAIDALFPRGVPQDGGRDGKSGRDLRLHVSGDVTSEAAERWLARGGGTVWTYTHRWREVPRDAWGPISVLASVESAGEAASAVALGYAPAMTVAQFPEGAAEGKAGRISRGLGLRRWRAVPCPAETRGATCVQCRLCLDRNLVKLRVGIAFELHGPRGHLKAGQLRLPVVA